MSKCNCQGVARGKKKIPQVNEGGGEERLVTTDEMRVSPVQYAWEKVGIKMLLLIGIK